MKKIRNMLIRYYSKRLDALEGISDRYESINASEETIRISRILKRLKKGV